MEKNSGGNRHSESFKSDTSVTFENGYLSPEEALEKADRLKPKTKKQKIKEMGFSTRQIYEFERMAKHPEIIEEAKAEAAKKKELVTRKDVISKIKQEEKNSPGRMMFAGSHLSAVLTVASIPPMSLALDANAPAMMKIQSMRSRLLSPAPLEKTFRLSVSLPGVIASA